MNAAELETKWQTEWHANDCFKAGGTLGATKFYNFDSGPFVNGSLHLGHIRTYVLGDMTARFQRLLGKSVLYATDWDAFGLPNEIGAAEAGVPPAEYVAHNIQVMRAGLVRAGISYDWSRVQSTCNPDYYRWTQWIFLELLRRGFISRRSNELDWCDACKSSLDVLQSGQSLCWRCGGQVSKRRLTAWYVKLSEMADFLIKGVDGLSDWSRAGRQLLYRGLNCRSGEPFSGISDWLVSRQRAWGTPIPIVHCNRCGVVPARELPVELPADLVDRHGAIIPLRDRPDFFIAACPQCHGEATRETDTLDCFFDDSWSFLSCVESLADFRASFPGNALAKWMPIDRFHSGFDTFAYLNLYRFMGAVLQNIDGSGATEAEEPIASYRGHDMVISDGQKMSKHLGNVVSSDELMSKHGTDSLRVTMLWATAPSRALEWTHIDFNRTEKLFDRADKLTNRIASMSHNRGGAFEIAVHSRPHAFAEAWARVGQFIEQYRPHAAIEELSMVQRDIEQLASNRGASGAERDAFLVKSLWRDWIVAISPFAPHRAEEWNRIIGGSGLVASGRWPSGSVSN